MHEEIVSTFDQATRLAKRWSRDYEASTKIERRNDKWAVLIDADTKERIDFVRQILYEIECEQAEADELIGLDAFGNDSDDRHTAGVLEQSLQYQYLIPIPEVDVDLDAEPEPDEDREFFFDEETLIEEDEYCPDRYRQ